MLWSDHGGERRPGMEGVEGNDGWHRSGGSYYTRQERNDRKICLLCLDMMTDELIDPVRPGTFIGNSSPRLGFAASAFSASEAYSKIALYKLDLSNNINIMSCTKTNIYKLFIKSIIIYALMLIVYDISKYSRLVTRKNHVYLAPARQRLNQQDPEQLVAQIAPLSFY